MNCFLCTHTVHEPVAVYCMFQDLGNGKVTSDVLFLIVVNTMFFCQNARS